MQRSMPADEVTVRVRGLFTTHHHLQAAAGVLGELTLPTCHKWGIFRAADGHELVLGRTSWWRGWHEIREGGVVLGTARPVGFWRRAMSVGFRGAMYELTPVGWLCRGWQLVDPAGAAVVEVHRRGIFTRDASVSILQPIDADLLVFAYYLVYARWQEQTAAASGAAAGS